MAIDPLLLQAIKETEGQAIQSQMVEEDSIQPQMVEESGVDPLMLQAIQESQAGPVDFNEASYQQSVQGVEDMGMMGRFGAGFKEGGIGMFQGAGNMIGLVDDDTITQRKLDNRALSDTTAGSVGQFIGEAAALAPLALMGPTAGAAATAIGGANKLRQGYKLANAVLPTAQNYLRYFSTSRALPMVAEGGLAGAIAANPNERIGGAVGGAVAGGVLNRVNSMIGRVGNRGIAKVSQDAKDLLAESSKATGRDTFIPAGQAIDRNADSMSALAGSLTDFASLLPAAKGKFDAQGVKFANDMYETNLKQMFGGVGGLPTVQSDAAIKVLRESGDVKLAIEAGKNAKNIPGYTLTQNIGNAAASGPSKGRYTGKQLRQAAESTVPRGDDFGGTPFRETAQRMENVMDRSVGSSNFAAREQAKGLSNLLGSVVNLVPMLGAFLGSQGTQNFIMGNTALQKLLQKALKTGNAAKVTEVVRAIQRAMVAQPAIDDESNDFRSLQGRVKSYVPQSVTNATTGFMK